jgi:hypothetical protein
VDVRTSTQDTALAHTSLNAELQPTNQKAQNLIGLFALTLPNDYHPQRIHVLFEMFPHGRHRELEQEDVRHYRLRMAQYPFRKKLQDAPYE